MKQKKKGKYKYFCRVQIRYLLDYYEMISRTSEMTVIKVIIVSVEGAMILNIK